ncbi:pyridoxamine 5'-phosphate oxidase family protein [Ilumatobacter sp.]|uniref:pyridoxamine 5'-phosphate oxidase family protein n=1 Tax=Ilumatobacter sp. TaxID=1967498 RepID=UPI003C425513
MTPDDIDAFLVEPRDAVLSVVLGSGRAMGTPIWFRWVDGVARFQSPTTSSKTAALRSVGRASLCVHEQPLPVARYVTLEGPVREVDFELDTDIAAAARHYLGDDADAFVRGIQAALDSGRRWASFELTPTFLEGKSQHLA